MCFETRDSILRLVYYVTNYQLGDKNVMFERLNDIWKELSLLAMQCIIPGCSKIGQPKTGLISVLKIVVIDLRGTSRFLAIITSTHKTSILLLKFTLKFFNGLYLAH